MASTSHLEVYNCTPQLVAVQINTIRLAFKVDGDTDASQGYYPASNNRSSTPANVPRVLTNAPDAAWTRVNTVTILVEPSNLHLHRRRQSTLGRLSRRPAALDF